MNSHKFVKVMLQMACTVLLHHQCKGYVQTCTVQAIYNITFTNSHEFI